MATYSLARRCNISRTKTSWICNLPQIRSSIKAHINAKKQTRASPRRARCSNWNSRYPLMVRRSRFTLIRWRRNQTLTNRSICNSQLMGPTRINNERRSRRLCSFRCASKKSRCEKRCLSSSCLHTNKVRKSLRRWWQLIRANKWCPRWKAAILCLLITMPTQSSNRTSSFRQLLRFRNRYQQASSLRWGLTFKGTDSATQTWTLRSLQLHRTMHRMAKAINTWREAFLVIKQWWENTDTWCKATCSCRSRCRTHIRTEVYELQKL